MFCRKATKRPDIEKATKQPPNRRETVAKIVMRRCNFQNAIRSVKRREFTSVTLRIGTRDENVLIPAYLKRRTGYFSLKRLEYPLQLIRPFTDKSHISEKHYILDSMEGNTTLGDTPGSLPDNMIPDFVSDNTNGYKRIRTSFSSIGIKFEMDTVECSSQTEKAVPDADYKLDCNGVKSVFEGINDGNSIIDGNLTDQINAPVEDETKDAPLLQDGSFSGLSITDVRDLDNFINQNPSENPFKLRMKFISRKGDNQNHSDHNELNRIRLQLTDKSLQRESNAANEGDVPLLIDESFLIEDPTLQNESDIKKPTDLKIISEISKQYTETNVIRAKYRQYKIDDAKYQDSFKISENISSNVRFSKNRGNIKKSDDSTFAIKKSKIQKESHNMKVKKVKHRVEHCISHNRVKRLSSLRSNLMRCQYEDTKTINNMNSQNTKCLSNKPDENIVSPVCEEKQRRRVAKTEKSERSSKKKAKTSRFLVMKDFKNYDDLVVKKSKIHGKGVFTPVFIEKNTLIMNYIGEIIGKCVSDKREKMYKKNNIDSVYMFAISEDMIIDATMVGNKARYINHSCDPNCETINSVADRSIVYRSLRDILPDEELTIDYYMSQDMDGEECYCGALGCKFRKI